MATVADLRSLVESNQERLALISELDDAVTGEFETPYLPINGKSRLIREFNDLISRSSLSVLPMLVSAQVDRLKVIGVRSDEADITSQDGAWLWWQRSRLDQNQVLLYRDSANYGDGFVLGTTGNDNLPRFHIESPLTLMVEYDDLDPTRIIRGGKVIGDRAFIYDDAAYWRFRKSDTASDGWVLDKVVPHAAGICPLIRFPNNLDSSGRSFAEILPVLPIQRRINQGVFDRLLVQRAQSWRQRWATGLAVERDSDGRPIAPFETGADQLIINESPDGRFGEFLQADIDPLLRANDSDIAAAAMITRTPPHYLPQATISSVSAEALVALEGAFSSKIAEKQLILGESHETMLDIGARLIGSSMPPTVEIVWADLEMRSLAQKVDAAVKKRSIGIPMQTVLADLGYSDTEIRRMLPLIAGEQLAAATAQAAAFGVNQQLADPYAKSPAG